MAKARFNKWNSFITLTLADVVDYLEARGVNIEEDRTVITGTFYDAEKQEIVVNLTSMLTTKQEKEFTKVFEELAGGK